MGIFREPIPVRDLGGDHFIGAQGQELEEESIPTNINEYLREHGEEIYFYVSFYVT